MIARELDGVTGELTDESRRQQVFIRQLAAALAGEPAAALDLAARYEQACLEEAQRTPIAPVEPAASDPSSQLALRLLAEENRLAMGARAAWVRYVRRELKAIASGKPDDRIQ